MTPTRWRRAWQVVAVAPVVAMSLLAGQSAAEDLAVPARVQVELVAKLAAYDRNFLERAAGRVVIAIVAKPSDVDSARGAAQIQAALKEISVVAGLPHEEIIVPWNGPRDLLDFCLKRKVAIVYLAPGLIGDIGSVASELAAQSILTVACVLGYVAKGAVLGFELVSGRTKLVINLAQAKRQKVAFRAEVLKLMRIVE